MSNDVCRTRSRTPYADRCAPQTWRYADGLRAALAFCDRVEENYDDTRQVDEVRWYLRRALNECGACEPTDALAAAGCP